MDLGQLELEVEGQRRPLAQWTADYVASYYPDVGQQCYLVPALHFNTLPNLTHTTLQSGSEPHTILNDPDVSKAVGDLAHTIVVERLDELSHHLQARGQWPFFIISTVNYDNYLAKLHTSRPKDKCKKSSRSEPQPSPKTRTKHQGSSLPSQGSLPSLQGSPTSQGSLPSLQGSTTSQGSLPSLQGSPTPQGSHSKEKPRHSCPKGKLKRCCPASKVEGTELAEDDGKEDGKVEDEGKQLLPPIPSDKGQRGEIDILLLHRDGGVVLIEVKATGYSSATWTPKEEELQQTLQSRVKRADKQLQSGRDTLRHIMPDLHLPHVTRVIALPYVTRQQLRQAVSTLILDPNLRFLCKDDLREEEVKADSLPLGSGISGLLNWWKDSVCAGVSQELPVDSMKTIVGRICGLMSVVSVWTASKPRVEVRTEAQAISECGRRLSDIVLLPRQADLLAEASLHRLWLTGPMGSGKTLLLQLKGRQWLKEGKRVIVINVRTASKGRPQGHVLEQGIRRDEACGTGSVERHDIALNALQFEILQTELAKGGPTDNACFVVDEVLGEISIIAQKLADHYPHCPIWCVASYAAPVPDTFQCFSLGAVLRNPPSVQLMLKELDLIQRHKHVYTTRSAARGLPCDGPPVLFIEHSKHDTHVRHLDCRQCADELADIFQNKLGLKLRPPTPAKAHHVSTGPADERSSSASVQSTNKVPTTAEAAPLSFRDVLMLVVLPVSAFRHIRNYHWEASIPEALKYAMCMCSSHFFARLRQRGVPLKLAIDNTAKEVAFPPEDEAIITDVFGAHSLERKVVFMLHSGPPLTPEEVTEHIARYKTIQASADPQTEMKNIQKLWKAPLDSDSFGKQLMLFASLMHEMGDILYPQMTIPPSPSLKEAKAIFIQLMGNMLVGESHSQPSSQDAASSTEFRRGMEYRCVSSPLCDWRSHSPVEGTEASAAPQVEARGVEGVPEADSVFFVPDLQEDLEQRQGEVQRIQQALKSLSDDDLDWEFFAASRCLSQYITILP